MLEIRDQAHHIRKALCRSRSRGLVNADVVGLDDTGRGDLKESCKCVYDLRGRKEGNKAGVWRTL